MGLPKSGSSSGTGYRQCSRDKISCKDPQAMQLSRPFSMAEIDHSTQSVPNFKLCLNDVENHVFLGESRTDPAILHAEELTAYGTNDHEGVGSKSIRVEQAHQGFPCPEQKQNTAIQQGQTHGHPGIWSISKVA
eukprot:12650652-Ditylum_brightwellii.AAC.1